MRYPVRLPGAADVGSTTSPLAFRCSLLTSFHVPTNRSVSADLADAFADAWLVGALPCAVEDGISSSPSAPRGTVQFAGSRPAVPDGACPAGDATTTRTSPTAMETLR